MESVRVWSELDYLVQSESHNPTSRNRSDCGRRQSESDSYQRERLRVDLMGSGPVNKEEGKRRKEETNYRSFNNLNAILAYKSERYNSPKNCC